MWSAQVDPTGLVCFSFKCGWENTTTGARAVGRTIVNVATHPATGPVVGAGGAGCLIFVKAGPVAAACEAAVYVAAPASDIAASVRKNLLGRCKNLWAFVGDTAFAGVSVAAGPAAKAGWKKILDEGEHRKIANRLTEPTIWAAGLAREAGAHDCK